MINRYIGMTCAVAALLIAAFHDFQPMYETELLLWCACIALLWNRE